MWTPLTSTEKLITTYTLIFLTVKGDPGRWENLIRPYKDFPKQHESGEKISKTSSSHWVCFTITKNTGALDK